MGFPVKTTSPRLILPLLPLIALAGKAQDQDERSELPSLLAHWIGFGAGGGERAGCGEESSAGV